MYSNLIMQTLFDYLKIVQYSISAYLFLALPYQGSIHIVIPRKPQHYNEISEVGMKKDCHLTTVVGS